MATAGSFKPGELHRNWKGSNIQYRGAHKRVVTARGEPRLCENCGTTDAKKFEWALRHNSRFTIIQSGGPFDGLSFSSDPADYIRLCVSCHDAYDTGEQKTCPRCGIEFLTRTWNQRFCSRRCKQAFHNALR